MPETANANVSNTLPNHLRPIKFALHELMFDLLYGFQSFARTDLDSILILLCVTDATLRPFMHEGQPTNEMLTAVKSDDDVRGSISRRMIADKTGLSRELVRRKTRALAKAGLIVIDQDDRVRSAQHLDSPEFARTIEDGHRAVMRYLRRLRSYDVDCDAIR